MGTLSPEEREWEHLNCINWRGLGLTDPIKSVEDKWLLIPAFLKVEDLVKQQIDSFNYSVNIIKKIVKVKNKLKYTDINVGFLDRTDLDAIDKSITPHECRLRDVTCSAPAHCVLTGKNDARRARMTECPLGPGSYFVQLNKNRIIIATGTVKGIIQVSCPSSTHGGLKSKTYITTKKGKICLRHNSIHEDSNKEILLLTAGNTESYKSTFAGSLEDAAKLGVFIRPQALGYIDSRVKNMVDDRDYVGNKRLELTAARAAIRGFIQDFNSTLKSSINKVLKKPSRTNEFGAFSTIQFQGDHITSGFVRAILTGNWSLKWFKMERAGVTHFEKTRKVSGPRALQPSQWGILYPSDTPKGEAYGLAKNLALMTHTTPHLCGQRRRGDNPRYPTWFMGHFRKLRRAGRFSEFASVYINRYHKTGHIASDGGRVCRPMTIVEEGAGGGCPHCCE
ncbi:beta and beta-prime subunits of DNA dependent RNA-polymerase [Athelia psychrophila]|uniref:DNA-directed RNA polymerase n=1 Tax=Athelia psychrophila TaxID=1759441 RepID=A0A167W8M7_9AGAM|nr:beta and beta-prime subunits of DNA dependent RNA-polymerase [Fibularhizoctonia sp. CBS 109695]